MSHVCRKCLDVGDASLGFFGWVDQSDGYHYVFDTQRGYQLTREFNLKTFYIDPEEIRESIRYNEIEIDHVDHVAEYAKWPGLVGTIPAGTHILLDGSHRASYCLKSDLKFYFYVLDPTQTNSIRIPALERLCNPPDAIPTVFQEVV